MRPWIAVVLVFAFFAACVAVAVYGGRHYIHLTP
jgi:hypothetical protein